MAFNFNFNLYFHFHFYFYFLGGQVWTLVLGFFYCYFIFIFKCKKLNSHTCVIRKLANHVCMYVVIF